MNSIVDQYWSNFLKSADFNNSPYIGNNFYRIFFIVLYR